MLHTVELNQCTKIFNDYYGLREIPEALRRLPALHTFNVINCGLNDYTHPDLAFCLSEFTPNLRNINLSSNKLGDEAIAWIEPLFKLTRLEKLDISNNSISDEKKNEISNMTMSHNSQSIDMNDSILYSTWGYLMKVIY